MPRVFYNNKTGHMEHNFGSGDNIKRLSSFDVVTYDEDGNEVSRTNDYQMIELEDGEAQYVEDGVLKKKSKAEQEAEWEAKKAEKKVKKDAVLAKLGITEEELKDLLN